METSINPNEILDVKLENGVLKINTHSVNLKELNYFLDNHLENLKNNVPMNIKRIINAYTQLLTFCMINLSSSNEIANIIEANYMNDSLGCLLDFICAIDDIKLTDK
jgi:hypothetical protein